MRKKPEPHTPDTGAEPAETGPVRTCIVTRGKDGEAELIRFVFSPAGDVVPDLRHKLPGRGAYVTCSKARLDEAVRKNSFARAFKRKVTADAGLPDLVESLLRRDALHYLSLANKAGLVVAGFEKIEAENRRKPFAVLLHASDASEQGLQKLARLATSHADGMGSPCRLFSTADHSSALGRENAVNIGIKPGQLTDGFIVRAARLERYLRG